VAVCLYHQGLAVVDSKGEIVTENNKYGGATVKYRKGDYAKLIVYYDADSNKIREETIFTSEYPVDNGLRKIVLHYLYGKKVREERLFSRRTSKRTLIRSEIIHFDRNTGLVTKSENHFIPPFSGYSVIYREGGRRTKIEWFYPENVDGIAKNVVYFDEDGVNRVTESYFTKKTAREKGIHKRVYINAFSRNRFLRKSRQEWYFTEEYEKRHNGTYKKIEKFFYTQGDQVRVESHCFTREGKLVME
jgi:hypothetical protein